MLYGYARVSTSGQATNGNSLEGQKKELIQRGVKAGDIYEDVYTGTKGDRPELSKLLERIEPGDTFMVCKLDRIARSVKEGLKLIDGLMTRGIAVHVLNIGLMDNTPNGKLMRNIFLAFAEFERDMIVSRTQEGKAIAKQKDGWREGRKPIYKPQQLKDAVKALETHSYKQVEEMYGISKSTLQRAKRADAKGELDGEGGI